MAQQINPAGFIEGQLVNRIANNVIGLPFMPSFYNSNYANPQQGLQNSEAARIARGDASTIRRYAGRTGGRVLGGLLGGPLGAFAGGWLGPHVADYVSGYGWNGTGDGQGALFGNHSTTGNVSVGQLNGGNGIAASGNTTMHIDPTTGIVTYLDSNGNPVQNPNQTPAGNPRVGSDYIPNSAVSGYMPAFNNGGNSWGFASSNSPYAMLYGGTGGVPEGLNNLGAANQAEMDLLGGAPRYVAK